MAQRVVTQLISDLSGTEMADGDGETVEFSVRGVSYTIDLTQAEAADFDAALATYVEHATRRGRKRTIGNFKRDTAPAARPDNAAVREWARAQGYDVSARGRISEEVLSAYQAAH